MRPYARWLLDFVHDKLGDGRRFRILKVVDDVTRKCLAKVPDTSISGGLVIRELTGLTRAGAGRSWLPPTTVQSSPPTPPSPGGKDQGVA